MNDAKYIGMDVHQATISVAVRDSRGNLVIEAILETKAETILQFIRGLRGSLHVTFEEGTWAAWLRDLLKPHVAPLPEMLVPAPKLPVSRAVSMGRGNTKLEGYLQESQKLKSFPSVESSVNTSLAGSD